MSQKLPFPANVLDQHLVMLGKTGSGKSSKLRVIVEWLYAHNKRVCIIDPKGDWWGVKVAADGKSPGLPFVLFGDFKSESARDVPINDHSGKHIAELIASGNRPCVIGLAGWHQAAMTRFWIDFASTLFAANKGELYLVCDEFHNFAPKGKVLSPQAGESLHWSNRLLSEGRGLGLVCLMASQRPQKVHNDSLTSAETLCALRVVHKADRQAVKDWIDGNGDPDLGREVLDSLAKMPRTDAWVWSPEIDFGPKQVTFPLFETFDSFAPPQLQKKVSNKNWADVDLAVIQEKLAAVIEEEKAKDPKELKKKIAELQAENRKLAAQKPAPAVAATGKVQRVEIAVVKPAELQRLERHAKYLGDQLDLHDKRIEAFKGLIDPLWKNVLTTRDELKTMLDVAHRTIAAAKNEAPPAMASGVRVINDTSRGVAGRSESRLERRPMPQVARPSKPARAEEDAPSLGNSGKRRILIALAQNPDGVTDRKLSILTDIAKGGGTWRTYMAELRGAGWIGGDRSNLWITDAGREVLGDYEPLPTGEALIDYWRRRLGDSGKRAIFDACVEAHPGSLTKDELSEKTGIAAAGGTWRTYMAELRGLEVIEGKAEIRASDILFEGQEASHV